MTASTNRRRDWPLYRRAALVIAFIVAAAFFISRPIATDGRGSHAEAVRVMSHAGVLKGYDDGELHEDDPVERYQMALLLARMMTGSLDDSEWKVADGKIPFEDVTDFVAEYGGAIEFCYENGIINGKDETHFAPHDGIKYEEALAMICRSVGLFYKYYPDSYINCARRIGLCDGISGVGWGDALNRGEVCELLYNLMKILSGITHGDGSFSYTGRKYFADYKKLTIEDVRTDDGFRTVYALDRVIFDEVECERVNEDCDVDIYYDAASRKTLDKSSVDAYTMARVTRYRLHDGTVAAIADVPVYEGGCVVYADGETVALETVTGVVKTFVDGAIELDGGAQLRTPFSGCEGAPSKISVKTGVSYTFYVYDGFAVDVAARHTTETETAVIVSVDASGKTAEALFMSDGFAVTHKINIRRGDAEAWTIVSLVRDESGLCDVEPAKLYHGKFDCVANAESGNMRSNTDGCDPVFVAVDGVGVAHSKTYSLGAGVTFVVVRDGGVEIFRDRPELGDVLEGDFLSQSLVSGGFCVVCVGADDAWTHERTRYVTVPDALAADYFSDGGEYSVIVSGVVEFSTGEPLTLEFDGLDEAEFLALRREIDAWNRYLIPEFVYVLRDGVDTRLEFEYADICDALVEYDVCEFAAPLRGDETNAAAIPTLLSFAGDCGIENGQIARIEFTGDGIESGVVYAAAVTIDRRAMTMTARLYAEGVIVLGGAYSVNGADYEYDLAPSMLGYSEIAEEFERTGYVPFGTIMTAASRASDNAVDGDAQAEIVVGNRTFSFTLTGGVRGRVGEPAVDGGDGAPDTGTLDFADADRDFFVPNVTFETLAGESDDGLAYIHWVGHDSLSFSRTVVVADYTPELVGRHQAKTEFSLGVETYRKGDLIALSALIPDWDTEPELDLFYDEMPDSYLEFDDDGLIIGGCWNFYGSVDTAARKIEVLTLADYLADLDRAEVDPSYRPQVHAVTMRVVPSKLVPLCATADSTGAIERVNVSFLRVRDEDGKRLEYRRDHKYSPLDAIFTVNVTLGGGVVGTPSRDAVAPADFVPATYSFKFTFVRVPHLTAASPRVAPALDGAVGEYFRALFAE